MEAEVLHNGILAAVLVVVGQRKRERYKKNEISNTQKSK